MTAEEKKLNEMNADALENYLKDHWKKQLKIDQVNIDDDFLLLGAQSIDMFRMLTRIENDFDCEIDFDEFFEDSRLQVLLNILIKLKESDAK